MKILKALIQRNLKIFLRNRTAVFFSLLSVIIIIGLYALFLGDTQVQSIKQHLPGEVPDKDIAWLVNAWIMAGIISVNTVTVTLGTYGTIVDDIEQQTSKDFLSSPIKRSYVALGYIIASWVLAIVLSVIGLIVIEIYIVLQGGELLSFNQIIQSFLIIVLSVFSFSAILFYVVSFIKSSNAYGTLSSIIGTLIGFLAGIYVPPQILPGFAKTIVSLFPVSYSASMLRKVFTSEPLNAVFGENTQAMNEYRESWGIDLFLGDFKLTWTYMIVSLIVIGLIFYGLSVLRVARNKLL